MYGKVDKGGSPHRPGNPLAGRVAGAALTLFSLSIPGTALAEDPAAAQAPAGTRLGGTLGIPGQEGPVSTRLCVDYTPDRFASAQEAWWIEFHGGMALDENTKATAAGGGRPADDAEYTAFNGVKRKLPHELALDVCWYDTDGRGCGARSTFRGSKNEDLV